MSQSIKEIEEIIKTIDSIADPRITQWKKDPRKGVAKLLSVFDNKIRKKQALHERFIEMNEFEETARADNVKLIAGVDEVGRGPLAGPVVAAAVILPKNFYLPGLDDSKKLSQKLKNQLYQEIKERAVSIGVGFASAEEIDQINIYQATKLAMTRAINQLSPAPEMLLIDAMSLEVSIPQQSIIKGDARSVSIAAASVVAKVIRDRHMTELAGSHPYYSFEKNAGYGTKEHLEGLHNYGPCKEHRISFTPVKTLAERSGTN